MYQPGFSHGPNYSGPPPAKKPKSNPIITKYPPPPGYKPPPHAQPSYQGYGYGQPSYPGYQQPAHGAPQAYQQQPYGANQPYQQPQWPGYPQHAYSQPAYQPPRGYYPTPNTAYSAPQQAWQNPASAPTNAPPQTWQPPSSGHNQNQRHHNSAPFPHSRSISVGPLDGNGDPLPPPQTSIGGVDDLEEDFDGECYFSRHPDEINSDLSLGLIEWQAPLPTKTALSSTFAEAELEALAPRKPRAFDEESISDYFTKDKRDEALLSVRQTEAWERAKGDVIFKEFPRVCSEILTMFEMMEKYRDRPNPSWTALPPIQTASQTPEPSIQYSQTRPALDGDAMDTEQSHRTASIKPEESVEQDDVLGNLEQALFANDAHGSAGGYQARAGSTHSRTASISSTTGERISRPKPLAPVRDHAQEDLLAALGVTGSPKIVYQTPGPAFGAPPSASRQQDDDLMRTSRQTSVSSTAGPGSLRPPLQSLAYGGHASARPGSAGSQHTANGSDFQAEDPDATPRPKMDRKRGYGEFENGSWEGEDATPRPQRYKQPRVEGSYGPRW